MVTALLDEILTPVIEFIKEEQLILTAERREINAKANARKNPNKVTKKRKRSTIPSSELKLSTWYRSASRALKKTVIQGHTKLEVFLSPNRL